MRCSGRDDTLRECPGRSPRCLKKFKLSVQGLAACTKCRIARSHLGRPRGTG